MSLRPAYLKTKLTRPIPIKDGGMLRTIAEAQGRNAFAFMYEGVARPVN